MISFACQNCGLKLKVKDEFAGRSSKCPMCKQPLKVPDPARTEAFILPDKIDGSSSSLDQAGLDEGVTLPPSQGPAREITVPPPRPASSAKPKEKTVAETLSNQAGGGRYILEGEIARGGMGAVMRGIDRDLRREVAIKFMLNEKDAKQKARFVEEAQITGQLEHPNIVPIHELGVDAQKRLFFTMKMVKGRSFAQILEQLGEPGTSATGGGWSLTRLLNILVNVCHALGYAHSRNVIHRDLKPANIMVGDFGEVYVMDWGLAKVLGETPASRERQRPEEGPSSPVALRSLTLPARPGGVATSPRDADLTQEGAIMGTPSYMPPEQARGEVHGVDQRSDIYSLGAILYALLTLQGPVEKDGDYLALLMRVVEGVIKKPEERFPDRARQGLIPAELSAIAMKALAKEPKDRYQTVEAFRQDIELFLAGHSVSAKQDTAREQVWKLIKRNKGLSSGLAVALVVLLVSLGFLFSAWRKTGAAYGAFTAEQKNKEEAVRRSVPALVRAGRQLANENEIGQAEEQVKLALDYDVQNTEGRLLKGQLLIARKQWPAARTELEAYLRQRPGDKDTRRLLNQIPQGQPASAVALFDLAESLQLQKVHGLAKPLLLELQGMINDREKLLPLYRKHIDSHWPGLGVKLTLEKDGGYVLNLFNQKQVPDLSPLKGLPLDRLNLSGCGQIRDLAPLQGMPLTELDLTHLTRLQDLTPLRGAKLTRLVLRQTAVRDLKALEGMPLNYLDLVQSEEITDLTPLKGLPLTTLMLPVHQVILDFTPLDGMKLEEILFNPGRVSRGIDVLRPMPSLKTFNIATVQNFRALSAVEFWKLYDGGTWKK